MTNLVSGMGGKPRPQFSTDTITYNTDSPKTSLLLAPGLLELLPRLNCFLVYRYLNEDEIDSLEYHSSRVHGNIFELAKTKCIITSQLLRQLYGKALGEVMLTDEEVNEDFGHCFTYLRSGEYVYIYQSYALNYEVRVNKMTNYEFKLLLDKYRHYCQNPNRELLTSLTGVEQKFTPNRPVLKIEEPDDIPLENPLQNAIKLVEEVQGMISIPEYPSENCDDLIYSPEEYSDDILFIITEGKGGYMIQNARASTRELLEKLEKL